MDFRELERYKKLLEKDDSTLIGGPISELEREAEKERARVREMRNVHTMQNAHGSGSAVGAGYFHRYRRTRTEELDRIAKLEEEKKLAEAQVKFDKEREEAEAAAAARTAAKRAARLKARERARAKKKGQKTAGEKRKEREE
jgi:hypothetical protein